MSWWSALKHRLASIARRILDSLLGRIEDDYRAWTTEYEQFTREIQAAGRKIAELQAQSQSLATAARTAQLQIVQTEVRQLADNVYAANIRVKRIIEAMGDAIVSAAQQRKVLEAQRRTAGRREQKELQIQIDSLHELRDSNLKPRQQELMAQRSTLIENLRRLNRQVEQLTGVLPGRGRPAVALPTATAEPCTVKFFNAAKGFGFVVSRRGDAHIHQSVVPMGRQLQQGETINCILSTNRDGKLRVSRML